MTAAECSVVRRPLHADQMHVADEEPILVLDIRRDKLADLRAHARVCCMSESMSESMSEIGCIWYAPHGRLCLPHAA